jgi:hypothetical protein
VSGELVPLEQLAPAEASRLAALEQVVDAGLQTYVDVGRAQRRWGELLGDAEHGGARTEQVTASNLNGRERVARHRARELADVDQELVDEMRAAGELIDERGGGGAPPEVRGVLTLADLGLNDRRVAEWRSLRDNGALEFLDQALPAT